MRGEMKQAILKCGYLLKKSEVLKKWNLRYFVLSRECLCYYQNEEESRTGVPTEERKRFKNEHGCWPVAGLQFLSLCLMMLCLRVCLMVVRIVGPSYVGN